VDSHVLMAVAGISSLLLGMPLEGALLFVLFHLSHSLEASYTANARASVAGLLDSVPRTATVVQVVDGKVLWAQQECKPVAGMVPGDHFVVKPGDTVPLDGVVIEGFATVGALLKELVAETDRDIQTCLSIPGPIDEVWTSWFLVLHH
jgi:Zn2+/Cd2+-exporting ATPase